MKIKLTLFQVDFEKRTVMIDRNSKLFNKLKDGCTKQKTLMTFMKQNETFNVQSGTLSPGKQIISLSPFKINKKDDVSFKRDVQDLEAFWKMSKPAFLQMNVNRTIKAMLLDPMSHWVLLLRNSFVKHNKQVKVGLKPQEIFRQFNKYQFVSGFLDIQHFSNVCPTKVAYSGRFFNNSFTNGKILLVRKFTAHSIKWVGLDFNDENQWQGFCTSYEFHKYETRTERLNLNQIAQCKNFNVLVDDFTSKKHMLCSISDKTYPKSTKSGLFLNSSTIIVLNIENHLEVYNEYLSGSVTFAIPYKPSGRFTLLTPKIQSAKINHQTLILDCYMDDILSIRSYCTSNHVKIIDLHINPTFYITISIDNYRNNFAFHVLQTKDDPIWSSFTQWIELS